MYLRVVGNEVGNINKQITASLRSNESCIPWINVKKLVKPVYKTNCGKKNCSDDELACQIKAKSVIWSTKIECIFHPQKAVNMKKSPQYQRKSKREVNWLILKEAQSLFISNILNKHLHWNFYINFIFGRN